MSAARIIEALDVDLDEIERLAELAASYWHNVALAADRGDAVTVRVFALVTRAAFAWAKALGSEVET